MPVIRFWAGARAVAGTGEERVAPGSLSRVIENVAEAHGDRMRSLLACSVLLLDGVMVDRDADLPVTDGAVLEVLPPYAGG